jgi:hypothetical protein
MWHVATSSDQPSIRAAVVATSPRSVLRPAGRTAIETRVAFDRSVAHSTVMECAAVHRATA